MYINKCTSSPINIAYYLLPDYSRISSSNLKQKQEYYEAGYEHELDWIIKK